MRKLFLSSLLFVFLVNCTNTKKADDSQLAMHEIPVVTVENLLAQPEAYDGKEVKISGMVTHVCKHSGKRLHLAGTDQSTKIRIEAGSVGQFERELEGSDIIATGIFKGELVDDGSAVEHGCNHDTGEASHTLNDQESAGSCCSNSDAGEHAHNDAKGGAGDDLTQTRGQSETKISKAYSGVFWVECTGFEIEKEQAAI